VAGGRAALPPGTGTRADAQAVGVGGRFVVTLA
jgi:hypothetical protein